MDYFNSLNDNGDDDFVTKKETKELVKKQIKKKTKEIVKNIQASGEAIAELKGDIEQTDRVSAQMLDTLEKVSKGAKLHIQVLFELYEEQKTTIAEQHTAIEALNQRLSALENRIPPAAPAAAAVPAANDEAVPAANDDVSMDEDDDDVIIFHSNGEVTGQELLDTMRNDSFECDDDDHFREQMIMHLKSLGHLYPRLQKKKDE